MLNVPTDFNYIEIYLMDDGQDKPFSDRMESFGFYSSYVLVQQVALFSIILALLCLLGIVVWLH